uniref:Leucine-rich repeat-containing protein 51 n=1 Tax=Heterosigma akashiwo TaxID=2829 RepID=A0A7S3XTX8_HETAK
MESKSSEGSRGWKPQTQAQLKKIRRLQEGARPLQATFLGPEDFAIPAPEKPTFQSALLQGAQYPPEPQGDASVGDKTLSNSGVRLPRVPAQGPRRAARPLDGFDLLQAAGVQFPDEARRADASGKGYEEVNTADLGYFVRLATLDVSENHLALEWFCRLPRLKDLRLAYNGLTALGPQEGYPALMRLDLSYNAVEPAALGCLAALPRLRALDLTSNGLAELPDALAGFHTLEILTLEHNQFDGEIPLVLAEIPKLRELYLAFNFIDTAPAECAAEGQFPALDLLDLAFNYVAAERDVLPLAALPVLTRVILYGNPLAGPTGEDPAGACVRRFLHLAERARQGWSARPLEVVLEQPRRRAAERVNRRPYRDVETVVVDEAPLPTGGEFREAGNRLMLGRQKRSTKTEQLLKALVGDDDDDEDEVDVGPVDGTFVTGIDMGGELPQDEEEGRGGAAESPHTRLARRDPELLESVRAVPSLLLQRPVVQNRRADPAKLQAAVTALRFALRNPVTSHTGLGGPGGGRGPARGRQGGIPLDRPTAAALSRALPRRPYELRAMAKGFSPGTQRQQVSGMSEARHSLNQIERVLDSMNERMDALNQSEGPSDGRQYAAGMGSLINMVNTVVDEFTETR